MIFLWLKKENSAKISEFFKDNFSDGWTEDMLVSAFDTGRFKCLSAVVDGETVGMITFSYADDSADIEDIVVKKSERKKGYGKALLDTAFNEIKNDRITKIFLEVRENNIPAINLYEKFGFNKISVRKKYYSDGENAIVMLKEI